MGVEFTDEISVVPFDADSGIRTFTDDVGINQSSLFAEIGAVLNVMETGVMNHLQHGSDQLFTENKALSKLKAWHQDSGIWSPCNTIEARFPARLYQ